MQPLSEPHRTALEQLWARMDRAYHRAAEASGFQCRGCAQNCCETLFYHHTIVEYLYLKAGLAGLPETERASVALRAAAGGACPLLWEERCMLYAHRPMICRLHGIPHRFHRPDGKVVTGPGCDDFHSRCATGIQPALDRTPLYADLARLEKEVRRHTGFNGRIKMTIAQMVVADDGPDPDPGQG